MNTTIERFTDKKSRLCTAALCYLASLVTSGYFLLTVFPDYNHIACLFFVVLFMLPFFLNKKAGIAFAVLFLLLVSALLLYDYFFNNMSFINDLFYTVKGKINTVLENVSSNAPDYSMVLWVPSYIFDAIVAFVVTVPLTYFIKRRRNMVISAFFVVTFAMFSFVLYESKPSVLLFCSFGAVLLLLAFRNNLISTDIKSFTCVLLVLCMLFCTSFFLYRPLGSLIDSVLPDTDSWQPHINIGDGQHNDIQRSPYLKHIIDSETLSPTLNNADLDDSVLYYVNVPFFTGDILLNKQCFYNFSDETWSERSGYDYDMKPRNSFIKNADKNVTISPDAGFEVDFIPLYSYGKVIKRESGSMTFTADLPESFRSSSYFALMKNTFRDVMLDISGDANTHYREHEYDKGSIPDYIYEITDLIKSSAYYNDDGNPFSVAESVCRYLSENYTYTYTPKSNTSYAGYDPQKSDMYNFLFNTKQGYCVHFATAATLILRTFDIESRFATGYAVSCVRGKSSAVSDMNAHAWTEIKIQEVGWIPVEATPAADQSSGIIVGDVSSDVSETEESSGVSSVSQEESETESSVTVSDRIPDTSGTAEKPLFPAYTMIVLVIAASVLLLISVLVFYARIVINRNGYKKKMYHNLETKEKSQAVRYIYRSAVKLYSVLGYKPGRCENLFEFDLRLQSNGRIPCMGGTVKVFMHAEFGGEVTADMLKEASDFIIMLNRYVYKKLPFFKRCFYRFEGTIIKL